VIIRAAAERNVKYWTKHLTDCEINDRAEMLHVYGFCWDTLADILNEIQTLARGLTTCDNGMYIAKFIPAPCEQKLTPQQWERAFDIFMQQRGIPEQQRRVVCEIENAGRICRYVVWERIDYANGMKPFPTSHDAVVSGIAAKTITRELRNKRRSPDP